MTDKIRELRVHGADSLDGLRAAVAADPTRCVGFVKIELGRRFDLLLTDEATLRLTLRHLERKLLAVIRAGLKDRGEWVDQ
jgi:hypothetical protein